VIIERYIVRQIVIPMVAICAILLFIFACYMAARYWSHALSGSLSSSVVTQLIFYRSIIALELLLPVTLYLSVIIAISRFIRQMELTAMYSCGIGPGRIVKAILGISLAVALAVAFISLQIRPMTWEKFFALKARAKSTFDLSRMNSGIFYEIWDGKRVIFAEKVSKKKNKAQNVFIRTQGPNMLQIVYARSAFQISRHVGGSPVLILENGREYEFAQKGENDFILDFKRSKMVLEPRQILPEQKIKSIPSGVLMKSRDLESQTELQWRLIMPFSTLFLALTGIGLALRFTAVRGGKNNAIVAGVILFACYYNAVALLKRWVSSGTISLIPGLWLGPVVLLMICFVLFVPELRWLTAYWKRVIHNETP